MNKRELCSEITAELLRNGAQKRVTNRGRRTFNKLYVRDDFGNEEIFNFPIPHDRIAAYTNEDVNEIIGTAVIVILKALQRGDSIDIKGFGKLFLRYRAPRNAKNVMDGQSIVLDGHYVPKFLPGSIAKEVARKYGEEHQPSQTVKETSEKNDAGYSEEFNDYFFELTGIRLSQEGETE